MNTDWIKARQTKYTAYATVYILIVVAALALANYLGNRHNKSFDSTTNKRFSLSPQTEKIVKNLKQDVKINYYRCVQPLSACQGFAGSLRKSLEQTEGQLHGSVQKSPSCQSGGCAYGRNDSRGIRPEARRSAQPDRRGSHQRNHPLHQERRAHRLLRQGQRRTQSRRSRPRRLLPSSSKPSSAAITRRSRSHCWRSRKCPRIARSSWWAVRNVITCRQPSRRCAATLRTADMRHSFWIHRCAWVVKRSTRTPHLARCWKAGA